MRAEVRKRGALGGAVRSIDEAAEKRHRMGLFEAIEAVWSRGDTIGAIRGAGVKTPMSTR